MFSELPSLNLSYVVSSTIKKFVCTLLWCHSLAVAGNKTTQPKQDSQAGPMSCLCNLLCPWSYQPEKYLIGGTAVSDKETNLIKPQLKEVCYVIPSYHDFVNPHIMVFDGMLAKKRWRSLRSVVPTTNKIW